MSYGIAAATTFRDDTHTPDFVKRDGSVAELVRATGIRHLAIIMDGNRRWARNRHLPVLAGHEHGVEALRRTALHANDLGLQVLSVYAFSTENWMRPLLEVSGLMELFASSLRALLPELHANGVRLTFVGDLSALSPALQQQLAESVALTRNNKGLSLQVAMNYGSRRELVQACAELVREYQQSGRSPSELTEAELARHLYTSALPDPDAILRTGGEHRLSNFLLWQAAYAEVMVTNTLWPDFAPADLDALIREFATRKRRFGR